MESEQLKKAIEFEEKYGSRISEEERPAFHVTPTIGWMNDPNGFSYYKGKCHLFYQYNPYSNEWGSIHWGHVTTQDFIHWERLPIALAPDMPYDSGGCFSGGATETPDGKQLLIYTGVRRDRDADGYIRDIQTQCVAVGDGTKYTKYSGNPVLDKKDLPKGGSSLDFRDPKLWRDETGVYFAAVANRTDDGSGAVLCFRSDDGTNWSYVQTIDSCNNQYGNMWECPDYFPLDSKQVLIVSPMEMKSVGLEFHAGHGTLCLIGNSDRETGKFHREAAQAIDYGLDFYAPQTLEAPDGRRIMIAWMQNWATVGAKPSGCRWFGQMTVPRELSLRNSRLCQEPVRELETCRCEYVEHRNIPVCGEVNLPGVEGRMVDLTVTVAPVGEDGYKWFRIHLAKDGEHDTVLRYKSTDNTLKIDRTRSGLPCDIVNSRTFFVNPREGKIKLRIVMDRFSIEVFANDGEQAASTVIYTPREARAISFESDGHAIIDVEKYTIKV